MHFYFWIFIREIQHFSAWDQTPNIYDNSSDTADY